MAREIKTEYAASMKQLSKDKKKKRKKLLGSAPDKGSSSEVRIGQRSDGVDGSDGVWRWSRPSAWAAGLLVLVEGVQNLPEPVAAGEESQVAAAQGGVEDGGWRWRWRWRW